MFNIRSYFTERSYTKDLERIGAESFRLQKTFKGKLKAMRNRVESRTPKSTSERRENLLKLLATVGEYSYYIVLFRPRPVQFAAGLRLHDSVITEIKTGEGKTLIGALVIIVKNLAKGKGTIVLTISDFLAYEGVEKMGLLYQLLNLSCVTLDDDMTQDDENAVYLNTVVYMTSQEYTFQFLQDGIALNLTALALPSDNNQRFFLIDEVDSVLLDQTLNPIVLLRKSPNKNIAKDPNANSVIDSKKIKKAFTIATQLSKDADYTVGTGTVGFDSIYLTSNGMDNTLPSLISDK